MKEWVVAFGTEKFYLTTEDKEFYTQCLVKGQKTIVLKNGMVLSDKYLYIAHSKSFEETKELDEGKWECVHGKWHPKSFSNCTCQAKYTLLPDGKTYQETYE
jgi:hypothetical protein